MKKKVVIIGITDWAGSAYHACQAVNAAGEFECRAITTFEHPNKHDTDIMIPLFPVKRNTPADEVMLQSFKHPRHEEAAEILEAADIIHTWNCLSIEQSFAANGLPIRRSKVKVSTWTGTDYRENHAKINKASRRWDQWRIVVQDPLFLFPDEIDGTFIPHAVDTSMFDPLPFEERERWVGTYRPSYVNYVRPSHGKDLPYLYEIVGKYPDWKVELDYTMPHPERMEMLRKCHVFVLDISPFLASWGRSGLEACALGIPTIQNTSDECLRKLDGALGDLGFVNIDWDTAPEKIGKLVEDEDYRRETGIKARKWIEDYFSYPAVGRKYSDVYRSVL